MDKYILYAEDDEILLKYLVDLSCNAHILGVMSNELYGDYYGKRVFDCEYGIKCAKNRTCKIIIVDKNKMLDCVRFLQKNNLNLITHWMPYWMAESNEIDLLKLFQYVGKNKNRFCEAVKQLKTEREIVIFHGNCHTHAIMYYLKNNMSFGEKYCFIKMPQLWNAGHISLYEQLFELEIFKYADYLFIQSISIDNRFNPILSTSNVLKHINLKECIVYLLPNMFSAFYFRQFSSYNFKGSRSEREYISKTMNEIGLKLFDNKIDWVIADMVNNGMEVNDIIQNLTSVNLWNKGFLLEEYLNEYKNNSEREKEFDIKIEDYIELNMRDSLMFVTSNHPTEKPLVYLTNQIMNILHLDEKVGVDSSLKSYGISNMVDLPIYPAIYNMLGLNCMRDRLYTVIPNCRDISFEEYVRLYICWVYGCKIEE